MKIENIKRLLANLHYKTEYVIHIINLNQAFKKSLKEGHGVIKFNQISWLKPYIDMNTYIRKQPKMISKKNFSS